MNRDEIRRLQKAARDKDMNKLKDWALQYESQVYEILRKEYEKAYKAELQDSIDNLFVALSYTLYFSEELNMPKENIADFMSDLYSTIDLFRTGEYKPSDYTEALKEEGVHINETYEYDRLYKEKQQKLDNLIKVYEDKIKALAESNEESNE